MGVATADTVTDWMVVSCCNGEEPDVLPQPNNV
jgi:hypothetical protein